MCTVEGVCGGWCVGGGWGWSVFVGGGGWSVMIKLYHQTAVCR